MGFSDVTIIIISRDAFIHKRVRAFPFRHPFFVCLFLLLTNYENNYELEISREKLKRNTKNVEYTATL